MAGRELGSGPHVAVIRLVPDVEHVVKQLEVWNIHADRAGGMLLGIAVGLVMAEDPTAMQTLEDIEREWREQH